MRIQTYQITVQQMKSLISEHSHVTLSDNEWRTLESAAEFSDPLLASLYDGKLLCVFGMIPVTLLSDTAHIWMYGMPTIRKYQTIFIREAYNVARNMNEIYENLTGYCLDGGAMSWLRWVGAEFGKPIGKAYPFTIRRA
jgi:hypothetical protein